MNHPLLQKASIVFSPTAYGTSTLNSIKPAYALGTELVTNGNFANGTTDWLSPDYNSTLSIVDGQMKIVNTISLGRVRQAVTTVVGKTYLASATVTNIDSSSGIQLKLSNGSNLDGAFFSSTNNTTTSPVTYTHKFTATATTTYIGSSQGSGVGQSGLLDDVSLKEVTDADFEFKRSTTATRVNKSGLIESVAVKIPRIDYLNGVGVYLNEWQSTNTATYSNDFTQGDIFGGSGNPTPVNSVITATSTTSPDGSNNGWKLADNNDGGTGTNLTSGDSNTFSVFLKKGVLDFGYIKSSGYDSSGNGTSHFNLSTGAIASADANHSDVKMEDYGNGWYRCSVSNRTTTDVVGSFVVGLSQASGGTGVGTRDGTKFLYMFGVQAEANSDTDIDSFLTSYIPTSGAAVTRIKDVAINAGNSHLINSPEGVFYLNLAGNARTFASTRRISLSDGTNDNSVRFDFGTTEDRITMRVRVGGSNVTTETNTGNYNISEFHKYAIQWKLNDFKIYIDGVEVHTDTSGATFSANTLDRLNFGSYAEGSNMEGKIKCIAVFKETLTDAELVTLTS